MSQGGGGGVLMSCVREGSIEPPYRPPHHDTTKHGEGRTGRFFRGLRRMFKRRGSGSRADASPDPKSSSTSELIDAERSTRRKEGAYGSGLSVSHDSVFTGERSGDDSSDERPTPAHASHVVTSHRAELVAALRRRGRGDGSDDDEDLGLPRSPPASPPTDKADKRHHAGISQSSCSDGSLLSVGSSEMDEDSSSGHHHDHSTRSDYSEHYNSSEPPSGVAPLSHSAAKHKMAVRPRRTHGAPKRKKNTQLAATALPITPELNEEMIRSTTPDVTYKTSEVVTESFSSSTTTTKHHIIVKESQQVNKEMQRVIETPSNTKLKSSSLPPGLALSHIVGQPKTQLSIVEDVTPRSSIKRSKSSSQGKSLQDDATKTQVSTSESHIYKGEKVKHQSEKYVEETYDKKSKSEKKEEVKIKKEESFFSRLLLRKSGKKTKKDQPDSDDKKSKEKPQQYKPVDTERSSFTYQSYERQIPVAVEKSINTTPGQKAFSNQMHKRIDTKGAYVHDGYKDVYSAAKISGVEYNITDLKKAEETDKMLNREMKGRFSRREEFIERSKRSSKEAIDEISKRESFNKHLNDIPKRSSSSSQRLDPFSSKTFINNEVINSQETSSSHRMNDEVPLIVPRLKNVQNDYVFHSGSMPKNIPYFNPNIVISASASPPKSVLQENSEKYKHFNKSSEHVTEYGREKLIMQSKHHHHHSKTKESYNTTGLKSLGEEFVETRSSIGKSHSFRYASETTSISSQESQMPSLPAIVGISEPLLESWEINYRRNVSSNLFSNQNDFSKRISARNYNIHQNTDSNYDSLPSTDSSYLDSLKTESQVEKNLFPNTININLSSNKRDSDISQIEAKIDDIISSPKPIISSILKSNSLDSVKSSPEKPVDDRRKTISIESSMCSNKVGSIIQSDKSEMETYISVTHVNKDQTPLPPKIVEAKVHKSDEKSQKLSKPEFLGVRLNRVDSKPTTNIVLTANVTPKKEPLSDKDLDIDSLEFRETKIEARKEPNFKFKESDDESKVSPIITRKSVPPNIGLAPLSPKKLYKRKSSETQIEKPRANSMSTEGSTEKIFDNISIDQKSHSSFGSKSSIQSSDSNEPRTPDRNEETVIYRKKQSVSLVKERSSKKNEDEPELMKVFARRSLKLKDAEVESISQEINDNRYKEDSDAKVKLLKNEFNASIKSRDSDKENDESKGVEENRVIDIAARVSQFGHYQRSISITSVSNPKRESTPAYKNEVNKYKKEISDSTPEKRLRNRTFPDTSNDRDEIKSIAKVDTLKRPWQKKDDDNKNDAVIEKEGDNKDMEEKEKDNETDGSPQFKGILQMRAEWERRAKQGMTK